MAPIVPDKSLFGCPEISEIMRESLAWPRLICKEIAVPDTQPQFGLRDEAQIFRQRQDDWHLEETCRVGVDDVSAVCIEEHSDLLLDGKRDCPESQDVASHHEPMWVL